MATRNVYFLLLLFGISHLSLLDGMDPRAPEPETEELRLFSAIQRIHDIIGASLDNHRDVLIERGRVSSPTPSLTDLPAKAGLFLITRLSMPDTLSTPWGTVRLTGSPYFSNLSTQHKAMYQLITQDLLQHVRAELQSEKTDIFGWDYKTYKILSIDGTDLPAPEMHTARNLCPTDSILINAWKALHEQYQSKKNTLVN